MPLTKIALIGANGKLGLSILHALLSAQVFSITVLSRSSSQSTYPAAVHVVHLSDALPTTELLAALRGQDALITTFAGTNRDLQIRLADAAAQAGVQRFIPADFGSCDSSSARALELMPLYRGKRDVRLHLQQLAGSDSGLSWTSLVCGHFFDYGLQSDLLSFDVKARKVTIFDGGDVKWSASTLETIALAVVAVLRKEEETRNRMLYIQSFCITQNQVLTSLEKITGRNWQIEHVKSEDFIERVKKDMDSDPDNAEATEKMVSVVGIVDANWEGKEDFANALLELKSEDLDQVIKKVMDG